MPTMRYTVFVHHRQQTIVMRLRLIGIADHFTFFGVKKLLDKGTIADYINTIFGRKPKTGKNAPFFSARALFTLWSG
jgi:hypothetical protein